MHCFSKSLVVIHRYHHFTHRVANHCCQSLNLMYDQSHKSGNIDTKLCNINLRSAKKVKLKSQFTRLTKVQKSPYYRGLALWDVLPDQIQTQPSKIKFKGDIKRYSFK